MKRLLSIFVILLTVSACDVYVVEPRYDDRNSIVGQYDMEEYSETYDDFVYYTLEITKSSHVGTIYLRNFYDANIRVYAYLDFDRITIPYQEVNGYEIEGSGNVYNNYLSFSYRVKDIYSDSPADFCQSEATRY